MDSWEWNKIAGAVLGTLLFILAVNLIAERIFAPKPPAKPGYTAETHAVREGQAAPAEALPDFARVLPTADLAHGKDLAARCQACHSEAKDSVGGIGPSLWGIVDRPRAGLQGYAYSGAMSAARDPWTLENLFLFLKAPQSEVPGTKMNYPGLPSAQDRIDLLAYMRTLTDAPAEPAKK